MSHWILQDIGVTYRLDDGSRVNALDQTTIRINPGERLAIIGANGSGKSTLVKVLCGIIIPTRGSFSYADREPSRHEYGALVSQHPSDNILGATVREELELTIGSVLPEDDDAPLWAILNRFGISHLVDRATDQLSGGETQLVATVCGLLSGRRLIVLDEPTSHLDPPSRRHLLSRLLSTDDNSTNDETAIVLVTQYQDEARQFPRVIMLDNGNVQYDGPPSGLPIQTTRGQSENWSPQGSASNCALLETRGLTLRSSVRNGRPNRVEDVSVTVHANDSIGLAGPIGSGKTTLAYALSGLIESSDEQMRSTESGGGSSRAVVLIQFPERQLFAETLVEDVAFGPVNSGESMTHAIATARERLARVELPADQFGDRSPFSLSGGQRRRAALAGVAACRAPVVILDEPTSALDPEGIRSLEGHLQEWHETGIAYVIISHDIEWLSRVTRRAWVMSEGRLIADSTWAAAECRAALEAIGSDM